MSRTSVSEKSMVMSDWLPLPVLIGTSPIASSFREPTDLAGWELASGVPTVAKSEVWTGGLQELKDKGAACWRLGVVHCL